MLVRTPATHQLLVLIAGTVIFAGSLARLYEICRVVAHHDEAITLVRAFGSDGGRVHSEGCSGRHLKPADLLYKWVTQSVELYSALADDDDLLPMLDIRQWYRAVREAGGIET